MKTSIVQHCAELNRCNQRGGRMLSILDLLDAGTLDLDLAAYLMAKVAKGSSFMVGANPGGAGKTTVMCALLNLVPPDIELVAATSDAVRAATNEDSGPRRCYICHEIGAGPYFAYLWDRDLRAYCALAKQGAGPAKQGRILATNLHADDLDETRAQVCDENGVPLPHFNAFDLLVYLRVKGGPFNARRTIDKIYASSDGADHELVFEASSRQFNRDDALNGDLDEAWWIACHKFLAGLMETSVRTIEETRHHVLTFLGA